MDTDEHSHAKAAHGEFPTVKRGRFADQAYSCLFHKILAGEFREGDMLPSENEMSQMFGVSRPVVREALERLRDEGLLISRRGLGSFVKPRQGGAGLARVNADTLRRMEENLEFRMLLEPQACIFACERRTEEDLAAIHEAIAEYERIAIREGGVGVHPDFAFHLAIARAAHNDRFLDAIHLVQHNIDYGVNLVRYMARFDHREPSSNVLAEHIAVLNAIERRDAAGAAREMSLHLDKARTRILMNVPSVQSQSEDGLAVPLTSL
jgi:GntR family transcriptional regulator, transcriptional repressor for pyruvate dehydrogenase complex